MPQTIPAADVVSQGWLLPLDKYADASFKSRFPDGTFHEGSNVFNGKLYSAPLFGNAATLQLYVNVDVFKSAGLVDGSGKVLLPQTWDDVTHYAEVITQKGNGNTYGLGFGNSGGGILGWWLDTFTRGAGSPGGTIGNYGGLDFRTGTHTFTDWEGRTSAKDTTHVGDFYTNTTVISDFEQYISHYLNHVNTLTGVAYKDDPTIMVMMTNNEAYPPTSWTRTISDYIRSIDSNHLIGDGYRGVNTDDLSLPNIDVVDDHEYPMGVGYTHNNVATVTAAGKVYSIGEYDWNSHDTGGDTLAAFLTEIESDGTAFDNYFDFWPHNDNYGYRHTGDYDGNYPGNNADMQTKMQQLRTHAYALQGITTLPTDALPTAPVITSLSGTSLAWRGATFGQTYSVERSTDGVSNWTVICNQCATDYQTPWTDSTQPAGTVYYRVRGYNRVNQAGPYSAVYPTVSSASSANLAAGKTVTVSSTVSWTSAYGGANLTDGDKTNFWTSQLLSSSAANEWAYVELGNQQSSSRVDLYPCTESGVVKAFPSAFTIQGTNDPTGTWTTLDTETNYATPAANTAAAISVGAQIYRYVRVNVTTATTDGANYYVQLAELEVR